MFSRSDIPTLPKELIESLDKYSQNIKFQSLVDDLKLIDLNLDDLSNILCGIITKKSIFFCGKFKLSIFHILAIVDPLGFMIRDGVTAFDEEKILINLNIEDKIKQRAPLALAVQYGTAATVKTLISLDVDVNAMCEIKPTRVLQPCGFRILHYACQRENYEIVSSLIKAGAKFYYNLRTTKRSYVTDKFPQDLCSDENIKKQIIILYTEELSINILSNIHNPENFYHQENILRSAGRSSGQKAYDKTEATLAEIMIYIIDKIGIQTWKNIISEIIKEKNYEQQAIQKLDKWLDDAYRKFEEDKLFKKRVRRGIVLYCIEALCRNG